MRFTTFVSGVSVLLLTSPLLAESYDAYGVGHGQSTTEITPVSETMVVINAHTDYDGFDTTDPANPLATASGPCFGSMIVKSGQVSGGGHCRYTDSDGEVVVITWTAQAISSEGATMGIWSVEGGTGKWDGASGGGAFSSVTDETGKSENSVKGAITLP